MLPPAHSTRCAPGYRRREPENGVLHRILREHLESFLALVARDSTRSLPRFVEQEFRAFLDCGVLQKGFARVSCDHCRREIFVAFSCKGRGFCPSCGGRRMASTAAHLTDSVLPEVPVRQWVLSLPHDIRFALGYDPQLLAKVRRCFLRKLMSFLRRHAREEKIRDGHPGAVCFVQRFDSALRLNPHFHVLALDGVFVVEHDGFVRFHETRPPSDTAIARLNERIARAVRKILLAEDRFVEAAYDDDALAPIAAAASQGRNALGPDRGRSPTRLGDPSEARARIVDRRSTRYLGFSLHASVRVAGCAHERREKLVRYMARPAIASPRLRIASDGDVIYGFKRTWKDGSKAIKLAPIAFLERLAALVPRPHMPLVTYHGILAPNAALRPVIVKIPEPPEEAPEPCAAAKQTQEPTSRGKKRRRKTKYYRWAELLKRVFGFDVLICDVCNGPRKILAFITQHCVIQKILQHCGLPHDEVVLAPARSPPGFEDEFFA